MSDETPVQNASVTEIAGVHLFCAAVMTIFFRWQKSKHSFWEAGDESLLAQGMGAFIDIMYWFFKPRILKWRNG